MNQTIDDRPHDRFVREAERRKITGLSRSTWWRMERLNQAPRRHRISESGVGWLLSELNAWMQSRAQKAA
jgi:prophage regulatory protein